MTQIYSRKSRKWALICIGTQKRELIAYSKGCENEIESALEIGKISKDALKKFELFSIFA